MDDYDRIINKCGDEDNLTIQTTTGSTLSTSEVYLLQSSTIPGDISDFSFFLGENAPFRNKFLKFVIPDCISAEQDSFKITDQN